MYLLIYFLIVIFVIVLSTRRPSVAFSFMLCTFALEQLFQTKDIFFVINNSLINVLNGAVLVYALFVNMLRGRSIFNNNTVESALILILYFYVCVSVLWSPVPEISLNNVYKLSPYILLAVYI